jgi:hypothetical protein
MAAFRSREFDHCLLLTDPSVLGITATGDVDDIAAILLLAKKYGSNLTVVICDDDGRRYDPFMAKYGNDITAQYKCNIIKESELNKQFVLPSNSCVFVHAPVTTDTADWLDFHQDNITKIYAQGESVVRANFDKARRMWEVITSTFEDRVTLYASDSTSFLIPFDPEYLATLHPKAAKLYSDYFLFQKMKSIGLPVNRVFLADMLFSDTGGPGGGIGNGIRSKVPKIAELRQIGMPPQDSDELKAQLGRIEEALLNTYKGGNPSTLKNLRDALWLLNQYCEYDRLLVSDGRGGFLIPDMSQLRGEIVLKPDCHPDIKAMFEPLFSTPLFDCASAAYALGITPPANHDVPKNPPEPHTVLLLKKELFDSLNDYNEKLKHTTGGRKSRRRRRKRRSTRR